MIAVTPAVDRFLVKVECRADGCWHWTASTVGLGYGQFPWPNGRLAHRFAYEHFIGPIPEGTELDHLCRNHGCVNPTHLEAVSHPENVRRGAAFGKVHTADTIAAMAEKRRAYWQRKRAAA